MKPRSRPKVEAASANIAKRILELGIGVARPSQLFVSSSTMPTPASRRSGNGRSPRRPAPPFGPMTASSAQGNRTCRLSSLPSLAEPPSTTRRSSSIPAWRGTRGVPSTSAKGMVSTKLPSSNSLAPQWRPIPQHALNGQPKRSKPGSQGVDRTNSLLQQKGSCGT